MRSSLFLPGDKPLLNLGLLLATLGTTFLTFFLVFGGGSDGGVSERIIGAASFSVSLVLILGSHEMGHYLYARYHRVDTSLPYFIPLPLLGVGTLGAVIRIRGRIPNKNALVDIGAAGPLAGLVMAIPLLLYGLFHSRIAQTPPVPSSFPAPNSLWVLLPELWNYISAKMAGTYVPEAVPARVTFIFGDNLLMWGLQRLVLGEIPPGHDVYAHPMVIAAWFGLLVTMLNLIPVGQLDGGHLTHAVFGPWARPLGKLMAVGLLGMSVFFSVGWLLWFFITTSVIGFKHPEVADPELPLSPGRKLVCALSLVAFVVCVMPIPLSQVSLP